MIYFKILGIKYLELFFLTEISFVTFFLDFAWFSVRQTLKTLKP